MTSMTDNTATTPIAARDNAERDLAAADAAMVAAREAIPASAAKLAQLEDAVRAGGHASKADLQKARAEIESVRGDLEWNQLKLEAAEAAHSRAAHAAAAAHRAVTADEYIAELERFNAPGEREHELTATLTATLRELTKVSSQRKALHHRLALDVQSWPADEQSTLHDRAARLKPAERIETHGYGPGQHMVHNLPSWDIAEAIKRAL